MKVRLNATYTFRPTGNPGAQEMKTTYGQLQNGDVVWIQGYRFRVENLRVASRKGDKVSMHSEPNTDDVIRFTGVCVDTTDISKTGYNGGTYGAYAFVPVTVDGPAV